MFGLKICIFWNHILGIWRHIYQTHTLMTHNHDYWKGFQSLLQLPSREVIDVAAEASIFVVFVANQKSRKLCCNFSNTDTRKRTAASRNNHQLWCTFRLSFRPCTDVITQHIKKYRTGNLTTVLPENLWIGSFHCWVKYVPRRSTHFGSTCKRRSEIPSPMTRLFFWSSMFLTAKNVQLSCLATNLFFIYPQTCPQVAALKSRTS